MFLGVVRSRPRRPPSCLQNTTTLYRHFTAAGSWEWYDHDHDGPLVFVEYNYIVPTPYSCRFLGVIRSRPRRPPRVYRIQLHCTDTLQLQVLGSGTITATTAPSCLQNTTTLYRHYTLQLQVLGSGTITTTMAPSCLQNTTTLYRHFTAACSWEWYDHDHDGPLVFIEYNYIVPTPYSCRFLEVVRSRPRRPPSCLQKTTTLYRHLTAADSWEWYDHGHDVPPPPPSCLQNTTTLYRHFTAACSWEWYDHDHDGPLVFIEYNYIVPTLYSCRFLGVVRSRPRRPPSCLQNTTTLYRHHTVQVLRSGTIKATTAPFVFVEYNYIVPTPYSCRFLGVVRSRPRRPPSCLQNTTTLYRHLTAAGSWEWYDHGHDGPLVFVEYNYIVPTPYSCRFLGVVRSRPRRPPSCLWNTTTLYRHHTVQVLGSGTIKATTAPLVFVEYNYIVPTPHSCRFLGVVRSRPRRPPSCLQNTTTLYRHFTAAGSWEWYDHGHNGPLVFVEYNYIVPTLHLTAAGSWEWYDHDHDGSLVFVEYNYIVPTLYSCMFLGVVRSRPRWPPRVYRIQLHCTDTLQLQVFGSGTITAMTAPLVFVENNYIVPTPYSCRFLGVVRSRPRCPPPLPRVCKIQLHCTDTLQLQVLGSGTITITMTPLCLQNTTTLYRHFTAAGSWEWYDHGHDGPSRVCRIQLHCTDTIQCRFLGVVRSRPRRHPSCLQNTTTLYRHLTAAGSWEWYNHGHDGPLVFVEYNYIVPTPYSCRFLGVVRSRPRRPPWCLQNTTTLYRHLIAAGSWEWYDHGHDGPPRVCRIQLHCTDTIQRRFLGVVRSRPRRHPSCLQNTTTLYRHLTAAGSWEWYDDGHDGPPLVCRIQLHCTDTLQLQVLGSGTITATTAPSCLQNTTTLYRHYTLQLQVLGSGTITTTMAPSCLQNTTTLHRHFTAACSWEWYDHDHDGPLVFIEYNYIVPTPYSCRFLEVVRSRP